MDEPGNKQKGERTTPRSPRKPPATRARIPNKESRTNVPPVRQANPDFVLKHYRLSRFHVSQLEAAAGQRHQEPGDAAKEQFRIGVDVASALGPVGENGKIGNYEPHRLAEILDPIVNGLIAFQLNQGVVPIVIRELREAFQAIQGYSAGVAHPPETPHQASSHPVAAEAVTEVDEQGSQMAGMFFGPLDGE